MAILQDVTITNFRGFDSLEITGLSKLNLFVGKNNLGKTSVLEAIFLLLGMSNSVLPNNINLFRGLNNPSTQIKYLFHNLSYKNNPAFNGKFSDNTERDLKIEAKFNRKNIINDISSNFIPDISGIELKFAYKELRKPKRFFTSTFDFENGQFSFSQDYKERLNATLLLVDKNEVELLPRLSAIIKKKEGDSILRLLQDTFDKNILGIFPMFDGIYFNLANVDEYISSKVMGDGLRRFLNIMAAVLEKQNSFILIDEIENGLHYTAYKKLWESLLSFADKNELQLFITTHSIETLQCLSSILADDKYETMRNYSKVFAISKTKESKYKAYNYSYEAFKTAIDSDIELRW